MTDNFIDINLATLQANPDVLVQTTSNDCVRIVFRDRYWLFWPISRCWIECDENDERTGVMHYGSVSAFYDKEIVRKTGLPKNHQKKWEIAELHALAALTNANVTISEAAKILERSEWSVTAKLASEHRISLDQHIRNPSLGAIRIKDLFK